MQQLRAHSRAWRTVARNILWQAFAFAAAGLLIFWAFRSTSANLGARGVASGFDFLDQVARVPVTNSSISFESGVDTYGRVLLVGLVNTIKISLAAIISATAIGMLVGAGRLSLNPLVRSICSAYVDVMRNVPVLLHILIWYMVLLVLPAPSEAITFKDWFLLSNRGLYLPGFEWLNDSLVLSLPRIDGLEILGGIFVTPEYCALLIGISTYTAAFIAEIFRGAFLAIPSGQWEAGYSVGMTRGSVFRRIVFPQASRIALPALTSEYLGVVKNSSLAVAIGYQDLIGVGNSVLFETGQAIEVIGLIVVFYIAFSLTVSLLMELVNRKIALRER